MSSRLVKKQLNSLIIDKQPDTADVNTRGVKKRKAKRKQSRVKLAKKVVDEQNVETKAREAKAKNLAYFKGTAAVGSSTAALMSSLLGIDAPPSDDPSDDEDLSQYF